MFSFSCALWLAAAAAAVVVVTTEASSVYNPLGSCYSSGLLIKCAHKVTCEHYYSHILCDANHVIRIHEVDYGRHDYATCAAGRSRCQVQNLFCSTPGATYKVAQRCNGRQACSIRASNFMFGEPCAGTAKYLQVSYFCEPLKVVCEGHSANLHCAAGKVIRIHGADYGRRYRNICSAGRPYRQVRNVRCTSSTPTYDVARTCNGRNNCTISASSATFGDPCPGTYKYLHLSFFCI